MGGPREGVEEFCGVAAGDGDGFERGRCGGRGGGEVAEGFSEDVFSGEAGGAQDDDVVGGLGGSGGHGGGGWCEGRISVMWE